MVPSGFTAPGAAVRALVALPEGAGNWGPLEGRLVVASCGEGTTILSCSKHKFPGGWVDCHLREGKQLSNTHRKPGVSSSLLPPGWLGKTSSRK